jgi:hypothetical protein
VNASWEPTVTDVIDEVSILNAGTLYTNGVYLAQPLTGGTGTGATANIIVAGGIVTSVVLDDHGTNYTANDVLTASLPVGSGFSVKVIGITNFVPLYQHEFGVDNISSGTTLAIESSFETNDLGWVSGGPAQSAPVGENKWIHLERLEPDFVQSGEMNLFVTGRPYAQSQDKTTGPYPFDPDTGKIDLREQRRELRLKIVSNVAGGDYQMGKVIVNADFGDVRGY